MLLVFVVALFLCFCSACFVVFSVSSSLSLSLAGRQLNFRRRCLPLCRLHPAQRQTHYRARRSRPRCLHGLRFVAQRGTAFAPRKIHSRGAVAYKRPERVGTLGRCAQVLEIQSTHRGRSAAAAAAFLKLSAFLTFYAAPPRCLSCA
jgi:hypothetical protein